MWKGYFDPDNKKKLDKFTLVWFERERRNFFSNTSYLKPGLPYTSDRLRQVYNIPNADPVCVEFNINQPRVDERYYSINLRIDESNRTR